MSDDPLSKKDDTVSTGIRTDKVFGRYVRDGYRVTWIEWDSAFRDTDLRIGDLIVGVNGEPYRDVQDGNVSGLAVGQHGEATYWQRAEAADGQRVVLRVVRDEQERDIEGQVRAHRFYFTPEGRSAMAPGGPQRRTNDGFGGAWSGWYEKITKKMSYILDSGWDRGTFNNGREMKEHLGHADRITHLTEKYLGRFAQTMEADWERVRADLEGKVYAVTEADLEYRQLGEERVRRAKAAAEAAWARAEEELAPQDPFPAPHPDQRSEVVGKVITLPWIVQRDLVNDLGQTFAVMGSRHQGYYFLPAGRPEVRQFFTVYYRFKGSVNPNLRERYQFIARVLDEPRMITHRGRPVMGLGLELLVGRAGEGEMSVDVRGEDPKFAGEEALRALSSVEVTDDLTPAEVVGTMVRAIQQADEDAWRSLFATWRAWARSNGEVFVNSSVHMPSGMFSSPWQTSRRLVQNDVYDARVRRLSPIRTLAEARPELGTPRLQEVDVFIDHIRPVDGVYRAFCNVKVHRRWTLQRLDEGPWRITDVRSL